MDNYNIPKLIDLILKLAKQKKFGTKPEEINALEKIALIHSEISEAAEAYRKNNLNGQHGLAEELADAVIRILHLAGIFSIDLEKEIIKKISLNNKRTWEREKINETYTK
jgi:NTP pyrophosphatase (non-canonical NTP hydrolase)